MSFDLSSIVSSSASFAPQRILLYGVQGLGKTTFGCTFESPILLRTEDGAAALDVPTFPTVCQSYGDIIAALSALHDGEHNFKTLVLDSLDWLEPLVFAQTCARLSVPSIESVGYGKGYTEADDDWRLLMGWLDSLRHNRGMNIVLIAHSEIKTFTPPDSDPYDRYQIRIHKRAFALWQEWADLVLFCNYVSHIVRQTETKNSKKRAEGSGDRIIYTQERPAFLAKNRWGLPPEIPIGKDATWSNFHKELSKVTKGKYPIPTNLHITQAQAVTE